MIWCNVRLRWVLPFFTPHWPSYQFYKCLHLADVCLEFTYSWHILATTATHEKSIPGATSEIVSYHSGSNTHSAAKFCQFLTFGHVCDSCLTTAPLPQPPVIQMSCISNKWNRSKLPILMLSLIFRHLSLYIFLKIKVCSIYQCDRSSCLRQNFKCWFLKQTIHSTHSSSSSSWSFAPDSTEINKSIQIKLSDSNFTNYSDPHFIHLPSL